MSGEYPDDLKYTDSHEYVRLEGDIATIGITSYATYQLGDIVMVDLPEVGRALDTGDEFGVVESVKAVSDLFVPVSGTVIEVNTELDNSPVLVNDDPHGAGWLIKVRVKNPDTALDGTLGATEYQSLVEGLM